VSHHFSYHRRLLAFGHFATAACAAAMRVERPDVVFASSTPLTVAIPGIFAKTVHRCPMVFEVRDLWPDVPIALGVLRGRVAQGAARWLERTAYRCSAHVIALSPGMRDGVVRAGHPADRVTVIPNLSDVGLFGGGAAPEDPEYRRLLGPGPLVVYTGTIGHVNGLDYLVALARETRAIAPEVRFAVIGNGKEKPSVERAARDAGLLGSTLRFLPTVPKSELPRILATADLASSFVRNVPALWDNSANKFFDALAAGRPVLINHGGWQADVLRESGAGIVVPAEDPAAGARLLVDFLRDGGRVARARAAAAALARSTYDVDRLADQALAVLERAVADHHAARARSPGARPRREVAPADA
jgi:glycosyltransferase involved in cell wall biosynthesis